MMLDLHAIAERPLFVVGMALALIATKAAIIMGIGLLFKMNWRGALALGLLLSQGGEFGFVLFAQAQTGAADRRPRRRACSARSSRCRWRRRRS